MTSTGGENQTSGSSFGRVGNAYLEVVDSPRYFLLWLGQFVSNFGDTLLYIALVVLDFQLTGQGVAVAALVAAEILPVLCLGPVAGVIIDRSSQKSVLFDARTRSMLVADPTTDPGCLHCGSGTKILIARGDRGPYPAACGISHWLATCSTVEPARQCPHDRHGKSRSWPGRLTSTATMQTRQGRRGPRPDIGRCLAPGADAACDDRPCDRPAS